MRAIFDICFVYIQRGANCARLLAMHDSGSCCRRVWYHGKIYLLTTNFKREGATRWLACNKPLYG